MEDWKLILDQIHHLSDADRGPYMAYVIIRGLRDLTYYLTVGVIVLVLGRRLIQGMLLAIRESRRELS